MARVRRGRSARRGQRRSVLGRVVRATLVWLACAGAVAGFAYGLYAHSSESPELRVRTLRVEGFEQVGLDEIIARAGVTQEDPILSVDPAAVEARITAMPFVRSCTVTREFPDTVIIRIQERTPFINILLNNHVYEIDEELVVLRRLTRREARGPFITGIPGLAVAAPGDVLDIPELREAADVWQAFSQSAVAQTVSVSELVAWNAHSIVMICDELPYRFVWGGGDYLRQTQRLDLLWAETEGRLECAEYLDLRFGRNLACR